MSEDEKLVFVVYGRLELSTRKMLLVVLEAAQECVNRAKFFESHSASVPIQSFEKLVRAVKALEENEGE